MSGLMGEHVVTPPPFTKPCISLWSSIINAKVMLNLIFNCLQMSLLLIINFEIFMV